MTNNDKKNNYYVSVTGMELISLWYLPSFFAFAQKSMIQAKNSDGIIQVQGTYRNGIHHTYTIWDCKESMQQYLRSGDHKEAMKNSKNIGSFVKVYGYECNDTSELPTMDEALRLWEERGRTVYKLKQQTTKTSNNTLRSTLLVGCGSLMLLFLLMTKVWPIMDNEMIMETRQQLLSLW